MQPPGKQPSYQPAQANAGPEEAAGQQRAPASAVNAIMGRLGLARAQDEPGTDEATLAANLADPSWMVRVSAVQKLGKMGRQAPLGFLLAALRDEQCGVRMAAARALARNPRQAALSALVATLEDREWLVRAEAARALGEMRELAPLDALLLTLQDKDATVRAATATALGEIGSASALEPLRAILLDEDWSVREAATLALAQLELDRQSHLSPLLNAQREHAQAMRETAVADVIHIFPETAPAVRLPDASPANWLERIESAQSLARAEGRTLARSPQRTGPTATAQHTRRKQNAKLAAASLSWPLKTLRTVEGVLAAVIITGLFVAWLTIETQPRSTLGQAAPTNTRSLTFTTYREHSSSVEKLVWSPDGQDIASADIRGTVHIWQASTGKTLRSYAQYGSVLALTWADANTVLIAYAEPAKELQVIELTLSFAPLTETIFQHTKLPGVPAIASWSSDKQTLAFDTGDGSIQVWNVMIHQEITHFQQKATQYTSLTWSPDDHQLATISTTGLLEIWNASTGSSISNLTSTHVATIATWVSCGYKQSGTLLVDSSDTLFSWSYGERKDVQQINTFLAEQTYNFTNADGLFVSALAVSPDGSQLFLATSDGLIQMRDMLSGNLISVYTGHSAQVNDIAWSPTGQHIATASKDTTVQVWQEA